MTAQTAFQKNAFQNNAFQIINVTATNVLNLPIDYVLAGQQPYKQGGRTFEIHPLRLRVTPRMTPGGFMKRSD